jgi:hypothetical protein
MKTYIKEEKEAKEKSLIKLIENLKEEIIRLKNQIKEMGENNNE